MLIKTSPLITALSGKIGGQQVSTTRDGMVIRNIVQPRKKATDKQSIQRFSTAVITNKWQFLTNLQRQSFIDTAPNYTYINRLGEIATRNGFQTYCFLNQNLYLLGLPLINTAPLYSAITKPIITNISPDEKTFIIQGSNLNATYAYVVYAQIHYSLGASSFTAQPLNIGTLTEPELLAGFDIAPLIESVYSTQGRTYRANIQVVAINTNSGNRDLSPVSIVDNVNSTEQPTILEFTLSSSATVQLPFTNFGYYLGTIDWGDGTITNFDTGQSVDTEHTYLSSGTYQCKIFGSYSRISSFNRNTVNYLTDVIQFGDNVFDAISFSGCVNLIDVSCINTPKTSATLVLVSLFSGCTNINTFNNLNDWDVSLVLSARFMFRNCSLNELLDKWVLPLATNFTGTFENLTGSLALPNLNPNSISVLVIFARFSTYNSGLNNLNVSNVTNLLEAFRGNTVVNQNLESWDVSNVTSFFRTFRDTSSIDFDLGQWDISSATSMQQFGIGANFSTANWDSALINWEALPNTPLNITIDINATHSASANAAYSSLISTYGWIINEGL